jgi:gluconate kinase
MRQSRNPNIEHPTSNAEHRIEEDSDHFVRHLMLDVQFDVFA